MCVFSLPLADLTNSVAQDPSWKVDNCSAGQEISCYGNWNLLCSWKPAVVQQFQHSSHLLNLFSES